MKKYICDFGMLLHFLESWPKSSQPGLRFALHEDIEALECELLPQGVILWWRNQSEVFSWLFRKWCMVFSSPA
jgi:hypothetical protein